MKALIVYYSETGNTKKLDQLVTQLENYLECLKLLNHYVSLARGRKFSAEDEDQFLEVSELVV